MKRYHFEGNLAFSCYIEAENEEEAMSKAEESLTPPYDRSIYWDYTCLDDDYSIEEDGYPEVSENTNGD